MKPRLCMRSLFQPLNEAILTWSSLRPRSCTQERVFSSTPVFCAKPKGGKRKKKIATKHQDPYLLRQFELKKAAAIARQELHAARRAESLGDPIRGVAEDTDFVKSFAITSRKKETDLSKDKPEPQTEIQEASPDPTAVTIEISKSNELTAASTPEQTQQYSSSPAHLNHFVTSAFLTEALARSKKLAAPIIDPIRFTADPAKENEQLERHERDHERRAEALSRILTFDNASSEERTRVNIQRCIGKFGRHVTDLQFEHRQTRDGQEYQPQRLGPDTGSSEVQIAILTARIRVLLAEFEGRSKNDKVNKRNLRLLLHRRQKLLRYFQKKDRGGERWENLIQSLGLTPATWEGEINVR